MYVIAILIFITNCSNQNDLCIPVQKFIQIMNQIKAKFIQKKEHNKLNLLSANTTLTIASTTIRSRSSWTEHNLVVSTT